MFSKNFMMTSQPYSVILMIVCCVALFDAVVALQRNEILSSTSDSYLGKFTTHDSPLIIIAS